MTNKDFEPMLLDFIKRRLNGDDIMDIVSDYLNELSRLQTEMLILHDFLVHSYPQDLVDAMNSKNQNAFKLVAYITEGWMARAKLSVEASKNTTDISIPITKN